MAGEPRQNDKDAHGANIVRNVRVSLVIIFIVVPLLVLLILGLRWYFTSPIVVSDRKDLVQGLSSAVQALAVVVAGVVGLAGLYFTRQTSCCITRGPFKLTRKTLNEP